MSIYDNAGVALIPSGTKASKLYSVLPANGDGDFTHSRGSTATRVNKDGLIESVATNVPRLDYPLIDGVVQDCPALLLEPQRTNNSQYSEDFSNSTWTRTNSTISTNQTVAPDGSVTADRFIESTATGSHDIRQNEGGLSSGTQYTYSVFVKAYEDGSYRNVNFYVGGINSTGTFSFSTGTFTAHSFDSAKAVNYGNGWYRLEITDTTVSTSFNTIILAQNGTTTNYTGDGSSGFYLWGSQFEQGSYATSYIPNLSSGSTTRSADVCNGSGTSAEFNDSEGVLFVETSMLSSNPNSSTFQIDDGTSTNRVRIRFTTTTNHINGLLYSGVSGQPNISYTANDVTNQNKVAIRYQVGQIDLFFNGFEVGTSTGNATPTGFDNLSLGTEGNVKQTMTFKTALTDSELETLTSWDSFNAMAKGQLYTIE